MGSGLILFFLVVVAACWFMVIGHQMEWETLNVARYPSLAGSLIFAYTVAAVSVSIFLLSLLLMLKK
jgi:hypothetical protein